MDLLLLGGNSIANKQWLQELAAKLAPYCGHAHVHHYNHWESRGELINLDNELAALAKKSILHSSFAVVGKSAGAVLALKGIQQKTLMPQRCIFIGTPITWAKEHGFPLEQWLNDYAVPTLFIQQTHDPAASFSELEQLLQDLNVKNYQLQELPGRDHAYSDLEQLGEGVHSFLWGSGRTEINSITT